MKKYLYQVENELKETIEKCYGKQKKFNELVKELQQFRTRGFTREYLFNLLDTEDREQVLTPSEMQRIGRFLRKSENLKEIYCPLKKVWNNTIYNII